MLMRKIRNFPDYRISPAGEIWSDKTGRFLKTRKQHRGYWVIQLRNEREVKLLAIHTLLLEAFVSKRPLGMFACHRDDNKDNNCLINIYWGTPKENTADAIRNGNHIFNLFGLKGEKHPRAKLNDLQIRIIRRYPKVYGGNIFLGKIFGISNGTVDNIRGFHCWK